MKQNENGSKHAFSLADILLSATAVLLIFILAFIVFSGNQDFTGYDYAGFIKGFIAKGPIVIIPFIFIMTVLLYLIRRPGGVLVYLIVTLLICIRAASGHITVIFGSLFLFVTVCAFTLRPLISAGCRKLTAKYPALNIVSLCSNLIEKISSVNNRHENGFQNKNDEYSDYTMFIRAICRICGYLSKANPEVTPDQIEIVNKLIRDTRKSPELIEEFLAGQKDSFDPYQTCLQIRSFLSGDSYWDKFIVNVLVKLVFSDRIITEEESGRLFKVTDLMGISRTCVNDKIAAMEFEFTYGSSQRSGSRSKSRNKKEGTDSGNRGRYTGSSDEGISNRSHALRILELDSSATPQQIKRAYLNLMKEYHPDRLRARGITGTLRDEYEEKCKLVTEAYNYLK